jgi:hypothetical protein
MGQETVIDTTVLQKANAPITPSVRRGPSFAKRIKILEDIRRGVTVVLYSSRLIAEYQKQIPRPRNDYIKAFFEILADPRRSIRNWPRWTGSHMAKARKCRYPHEDRHVLRTAIRPDPSVIISEEARMLATDACVYREFRIHIRGL